MFFSPVKHNMPNTLNFFNIRIVCSNHGGMVRYTWKMAPWRSASALGRQERRARCAEEDAGGDARVFDAAGGSLHGGDGHVFPLFQVPVFSLRRSIYETYRTGNAKLYLFRQDCRFDSAACRNPGFIARLLPPRFPREAGLV